MPKLDSLLSQNTGIVPGARLGRNPMPQNTTPINTSPSIPAIGQGIIGGFNPGAGVGKNIAGMAMGGIGAALGPATGGISTIIGAVAQAALSLFGSSQPKQKIELSTNYRGRNITPNTANVR